MTKSFTREDIYAMVWDRPMTKVAAELGISDVALAKICRKNDIPRPYRGHWAKLAAGKPVPTTPLPPLPKGQDAQVHISGSPLQSLPRQVKAAHDAAKKLERSQSAKDPDSNSPTPELPSVFLRFKEKVVNAKARKDGYVRLKGRQNIPIELTLAQVSRALLFLERLVRRAQIRGYNLAATKNGLALVVDDEDITLSLVEILEKVPHEATPHELSKLARWEKDYNREVLRSGWASTWDKPTIPEFDQQPSGRLMIEIDIGHRHDGIRRRFKDGKTQRLENMADKVITAATTCATAAVERRKEAVRRQIEQELREKLWRERSRKEALEKKRWELFDLKMKKFTEAQRLRHLVDDYKQHYKSDSALGACDTFLAWAVEHAESLFSDAAPTQLAGSLDKYPLMDDTTEIPPWTRIDD